MKKVTMITLLLIALSTLSLSTLAQSRKKLSSSALDRSLSECLYKYDNKYEISHSQHKRELDIPHCGGTIEIKQSKSYREKIPHIILRDTKKCSYVTIGTNRNFETKSQTTHYALNGYRTNFNGSYVAKESQINFNGRGVQDNNVRLVVHSKSGKTCARIKVSLGNVY